MAAHQSRPKSRRATHVDASSDDLRRLIAKTAARLVAEDGFTHYAQAKQKAARQIGAPDSAPLPSDDELDEAVREYQLLFQGETHPGVIHTARATALSVMQRLSEFRLYLVGAVLSGSATEHSPIELEVFTDNHKDIELALINQRISYRVGAAPGSRQGASFVLKFRCEGAAVELSVHPANALRSIRRKSDADARASLADLKSLLDPASVASSRL